MTRRVIPRAAGICSSPNHSGGPAVQRRSRTEWSMLLHMIMLGSTLMLPQQRALPAGSPAPDRLPTAPLTAVAVRTRQAPTIDGRNEDGIWRNAPKVSEFRQFAPHVNIDPSFRTEFQTAYDEH